MLCALRTKGPLDAVQKARGDGRERKRIRGRESERGEKDKGIEEERPPITNKTKSPQYVRECSRKIRYYYFLSAFFPLARERSPSNTDPCDFFRSNFFPSLIFTVNVPMSIYF